MNREVFPNVLGFIFLLQNFARLFQVVCAATIHAAKQGLRQCTYDVRNGHNASYEARNRNSTSNSCEPTATKIVVLASEDGETFWEIDNLAQVGIYYQND